MQRNMKAPIYQRNRIEKSHSMCHPLTQALKTIKAKYKALVMLHLNGLDKIANSHHLIPQVELVQLTFNGIFC